MIQDMQGILRGEHRFLYIDPAQLCLCGIEKVFYKILLHIHILIVQLAQILLVNIPSGPHEGKFYKTGHRRRHNKAADSPVSGIHQQCLLTQMV